ncbi:hypothetical protein HK100_000036 [Physocladia obscura]|uniref:Uncharacterized protein n=1 Tax=Physocladia obscura TaxID=109957 RepID=A0AAD5XMV9_9FUNG|nr:hypothetical protein HK100_000036 [Physocladia obscura]
MRHINAFLNDPEDEFVDAAAAVAAVAAANNNNNQELFAAAENPLYVAIKLIILVAMITRGHIYNRQSAIIISFCLAYFTWALRKWYIQQYPHAVRVNGVVAQPQRPIANIVPAAAAAADTPAVVPLDGQGINTTVYQDVFYFVHDFFASLVPGMDDRLYNREQPQPHDAGVGAAGGVAVDAFQG